MSTHAPALPAVDSFPDGQLSVAALECFQYATGVQLFLNIGTEWQQFSNLIGMTYSPLPQSPEERGRDLTKKWLEGKSKKSATWKSLVETLARLKETSSIAIAISNFFNTSADTIRLLEKCRKQTKEIESNYVHIHVCASMIHMCTLFFVLAYIHACAGLHLQGGNERG